MRKQLKRSLVSLILFPVLLLGSCRQTPSAGMASPDTTPAPSYQTVAGYAIKTDYAGLTPYTPAAEKHTRLSDGPLPELKASNDYGMLLPYAGETLYNNEGSNVTSLYGLVTKNAMIVTDPVYTGAWQGYYYELGSNTGKYMPAYNLQKLADTIDKKDPWKSVRNGACALDGSWVTSMDYTAVYFLDAVIVLVRDDEKSDVDVMDYNGNLLYNSKSLSCYKELPPQSAYLFQSGYGEGLFALTLNGGKVAYVDAKSGVEKSLDYDECSAFSGGLSAVKKDGLTGFIDRNYNLVIAPQFASAEFFYNGRNVVQYPDGSYALIDTSGKPLLSSPNYISRWDAGTYGIYDGVNTTRYYGYDLKEIKWHNAFQIGPQYGGWFSYKTPEGVAIFNKNDNKTVEFKGMDGVGYIRNGLVSVYADGGEQWKEGLMTIGGRVLIPPAEKQNITISVSEITGKAYIIAGKYDDEAQSYKIYDRNGKLLLGGIGWANFMPQLDLFEIHSDFSEEYADTSGNILFRYSLMAYVPD